MSENYLDFAIIGAGVAGITAALSLDQRYQVGIFCKRPLGSAASSWAQGGIAAVVHSGDSFSEHQQDTETAGAGLCDSSAVQLVTDGAPAAIEWLAAQGVPFNTDINGALSLGREGGHSRRRIVHIDDRSGQAVLAALIAQLQQRKNITLYDHHIAVDLSVVAGRCNGFYALNLKTQQVLPYTAGGVLLATGGASRVYLYSSTPEDTTGDGIGMAYRAGCRIRNMEFVQFHPTCLYHSQPPTLLISEAVRGEGGRLLNEQGQEFTANAHPLGDLAPRDIVARTIDSEMKKTGADCVYLDCGNKGADFWRQRFPTIVAECAARGIRIPEDRIPVVPAAHYCCGGIYTDLHGQTDIAGLYAAGETASTGLHGANRLASNSLLECVVMGRLVAEALPPPVAAPVLPEWDEQRISQPRETVMVAHNWDELRRIMWNYVGIVRSDQRLQRARHRVQWIREEIDEFYRRHRVSRDFLELRNLAQCAELIIEGALGRRESRGLHYNIDCPNTMKARDTELTLHDFQQRQQAINEGCPFSNRMIVAGSTTTYNGSIVGFCNPQCRDDFAATVANGFDNASASHLAAKEKFDALLAKDSSLRS
ncbi:MAG: L-aspartate oxidase [Proteobacteria bacterium]|nr:L-aspartate oxidase [Pseudomonadota bacterium]